ncbi:MAG: hypothetical protein ABH869_00835 [Candidatus Omnitrophota bacterium]
MIEKMKKITLLVSENERDKFLSCLRKAGLVHIKHVNPPVHHEINFAEDRITKIEHLVSILRPYYRGGRQSRHEPGELCERVMLDETDKIQELNQTKEDLKAVLAEVDKNIKWFGVWGDFDPRDIALFDEKGVKVILYCFNKEQFKQITKQGNFFVIKREKGYVYCAGISPEGLEEEELAFFKAVLPVENLTELREEKTRLEKEILIIESFLSEEADSLPAFLKCEELLKKEREFFAVKFGMQEEGKFSYLQGFCPAKKIKKIISLAKKEQYGYLIEDPDNPEETPTLITNPGWISIIKPVFRFMNTLPGYDEADISFYFLVFFSLFFAMLIGDAGYGVLFLLITFIARKKLPQVQKEPFFLMYLLSIATIVWGAVTGTWFGAERIAEVSFLNVFVIKRISSFADNNQNLMIFICFIIGAIHLTIAHLIRGVRVINSLKAFAEAGWIMILWGMFFTAGKFVLGNSFPPVAGWLFGVGTGLVLLFSNQEKGLVKGMFSTLAELPLSIISSFSDIVSYLRLFAVGYATVVVAGSFNEMALSGGISGPVGAFSAAIILFLGHTLNIVLGFMAVIVHGIRLNMLEFSGHLGMQWTGKKYEPFREEE